MDRLSSCYFCGAAFDATLDEQPVVPSSLHPSADDQKTVVLCRTCQRKLDAVLDTVLDAIDSDASGVATDPNQGSSNSTTEGGDLESTLGDDEDILQPLGDDDESNPQDSSEAAEASEMEFGDDRARKQAAEERDEQERAETADDAETTADDADDADDTDGESGPKYTDSRGAGFRKEEEGPAETGSLTGGAFEDTDDDRGRPGSSSRRRSRSSSSGSSSDSASSEQSSGGQSGSSSGQGSGGRSASSSGGSEDDEADNDNSPSRNVTMSRLENTKVMRLLENREFPVEKDEFVTVAANAYQISRDDCEKVIDLAVEHDLLREESGQLYGSDS